MQIRVSIQGADAVRAILRGMGKQVNYAASRALNTAAFAVNTEVKKEMTSTFAGGATAYTLHAFKVGKAAKSSLTATVALRTDTQGSSLSYDKALGHMFTGGQRRYKMIEGWLRARGLLPGGLIITPGEAMPLDRFGNMRLSSLTEMLGVLGTQRKNLRVYHGRGKQQKAISYFVILPSSASHLHPGIYKRIESGVHSALRPMVLYVSPGSYRKFIDLDKIGKETVAKTFSPAFDSELSKALASARS